MRQHFMRGTAPYARPRPVDRHRGRVDRPGPKEPPDWLIFTACALLVVGTLLWDLLW